MKQAYLITAYKDFDQLKELAELLSETSYVFIHIDEKSKNITDEQIEQLNAIDGCRALRFYSIQWGSFHHLEALVLLMVLALQKEDAGYIHFLTGEDLPLLSPKELDERFLNDDKIYLSYIKPEDQPQQVKVRYRYTNIMANKNVKNKVLWKIQDLSGVAQEKIGMIHDGIGTFLADRIYKGLVYISMPRAAALYVLRFISSGDGAMFWKDLARCQVPEEFFFQTVFLNSPEWKDRIVDMELRYMDWTKGDGSSPAYLTDSDYDAVKRAKEAGCCFARKFHPYQSRNLRNRLINEMKS